MDTFSGTTYREQFFFQNVPSKIYVSSSGVRQSNTRVKDITDNNISGEIWLRFVRLKVASYYSIT